MKQEPVRIFWRVPERCWCVEPVTATRLEALVEIWELNFVDYVPLHAIEQPKVQPTPIPSVL